MIVETKRYLPASLNAVRKNRKEHVMVSEVRVVVRIREEQLEWKIKRCIKGDGSFAQF